MLTVLNAINNKRSVFIFGRHNDILSRKNQKIAKKKVKIERTIT